MVKSKGTQTSKIIFSLLIIIILASCGKNYVSKKDVALLMDEYYSISEEGDFDLLAFYYSDRIPREEWEEAYYLIHSILGQIVSVKLESSRSKTFSRYRTPGKYFTLVYKNKYENAEVTETINLFVPKGSTEVKITAHNYNSDIFGF